MANFQNPSTELTFKKFATNKPGFDKQLAWIRGLTKTTQINDDSSLTVQFSIQGLAKPSFSKAKR